MAERRMFAKTIIDSDAFLDMPVTARLLYYDLGMRADDDGFVNSPKKIMRMVGASEDDLRILSARKFIIPFANGVVVIKHWRIHNYIKKDRHKETTYKKELAMLQLDESKAYTLADDIKCTEFVQIGHNPDTDCIQDGYNMDTQVRLGKDSIGKSKDRLESGEYIVDTSINERGTAPAATEKQKRFIPPSLEEISAYCHERGNQVDPQRFLDFYTSNGWKVGRNPMKDWKAAVRTWEKNVSPARNKNTQASQHDEFMQIWREA